MNRIKFLTAFFAFSLLLLVLPGAASAQYRDRDDDDYYGNSRNNRNNRNNDYNRRYLVDAVRRVEDNSRSFRRALDRDLDDTRYDETRREDRINDVAERFATAADNLEDAFDNARNINSSQDEARDLLQLASQLDRFIGRNRFSNNVESSWNNIRRDLDTIADAYNLRFNGNNRRNNRRGSDDDYYGRDDRDDRNDRSDRNRDRSNNRRFPRLPRFPF